MSLKSRGNRPYGQFEVLSIKETNARILGYVQGERELEETVNCLKPLLLQKASRMNPRRLREDFISTAFVSCVETLVKMRERKFIPEIPLGYVLVAAENAMISMLQAQLKTADQLPLDSVDPVDFRFLKRSTPQRSDCTLEFEDSLASMNLNDIEKAIMNHLLGDGPVPPVSKYLYYKSRDTLYEKVRKAFHANVLTRY